MEISTHVDMDAVQSELRRAHYEIPNKVRSTLKAVGQEIVQPAVQRRAPSVVRPNMVVRTTTTRAYVTVAGPRQQDRIAGLLNYGGYLNTPIFPKTKQAVMTPWGPRSVVWRGTEGKGKAGHVTGKHFIEAGIQESAPAMQTAFAERVLEVFEPLDTSI